jgi:hypothetical protein
MTRLQVLRAIRNSRGAGRAAAVLGLAVILLVTVNGIFPPNVSFVDAPSSPFPVDSGPSAVALADFNGDGILDLVVVNGNANAVSTFIGNGGGTFTPAANSPRATDASLSIAVAVGDFNGDGKMDVVATDIPGGLTGLFNGLTGSVGGNVSFFAGLGTGSLASHNDSGTGANFPAALAVGDFNHDGRLDLAVANLNDGTVTIMLGNGDGTFSQGEVCSVGNHPTSVAVADFNLDGKLDLAVTDATDDAVTILLGNGDGTFTPVNNITVHLRPVAVVAADFNGDGKPDLAIADLLSSTVTILLGDGTGNFSSSNNFPVGRNPTALVVGDFNNDGRQDLAVVNRLSEMVSVLLGNGDGTFRTYRNFSVEASPVAIAAGDLNGDGKLDLVVANAGSNSISVLLNNTDLTPPTLTMPNLASSYVYNSSLLLTFGATDPLAGIYSMQATLNGVPVSSGQTVVLNQPGTNTFTLTATDNVGNVATQSATFTVLYNWLGLNPPIPSSRIGIFSAGTTIPLKFQLTDAAGNYVATANATVTVQMLSNGIPVGTPIAGIPASNADTGDTFRYMSGPNRYMYNLSTASLSTGTWQLQIHLNDGSVHDTTIGLN